MIKYLILLPVFLFVSVFGCQTISAQFPIKIPKISKPKIEQPKTDESKSDANPSVPNNPKSNDNRSARTSNQKEYLEDPPMTNVPQFLIETLEIKAHNENKYVKAPSQNDYSSWLPQVSFDVLYAEDAPKLRYTAEWFNPDGSLWFSEPLEFNNSSGDFPTLRSPYESVDVNPKAIVALGTYGLKLTDTKTSQTVFQGKFKVSKMLPDPKLKNKNLFYVENDWMLPIGYVGFLKTYTDYDVHTRPMVFFWFKGVPANDKFEGELYFNNQRIATTDKGGHVNKYAERGEDCFMARDLCADSLVGFEWDNFVVDNSPNARQNNPNGYFTNDHAGEYTVKVFYNGDQVREAKFTIDAKGLPTRNAFSEQVFLNDYRVIVPVKIVGTTEKYNAASWKTDSFYGNPLKGFVAP
ncbi:MAG: hypothetical protein ACR2HG_11220 [Pyrinomonadaceae bacterium]